MKEYGIFSKKIRSTEAGKMVPELGKTFIPKRGNNGYFVSGETERLCNRIIQELSKKNIDNPELKVGTHSSNTLLSEEEYMRVQEEISRQNGDWMGASNG